MTLLHVVDAILALTLLEGTVLLLWRRLPSRLLLPNLAAGLLLMLALRAGLADCTVCVLLALAGAGIAHALDLALRLAPLQAPQRHQIPDRPGQHGHAEPGLEGDQRHTGHRRRGAQ